MPRRRIPGFHVVAQGYVADEDPSRPHRKRSPRRLRPSLAHATQSVKGPAADSPLERFKRLVQRGSPTDILFYQETRLAAEAAGLGRLCDAKIDEYVRRLYGLKSYKPSKMQNGKMKQDRGFKGLVLCDDGFDERAERVRRVETVKQSVRSEL